MKRLVLAFVLVGAALAGRCQAPNFFLDSVQYGVSALELINPMNIDGITVVKKENAVYVRLKPGHRGLVPFMDYIKDTLGALPSPVAYIVDDHLVAKPDSALIDTADVRLITTAKTGSCPVTLVLVTTAAPKPARPVRP